MIKTSRGAAEIMIGKKRIVLITGAGINISAGIPNLQDEDAFKNQEDRYGGVCNPREILLHSYFLEKPHLLWKFIYDYIAKIDASKPNAVHRSITKFLEYSKSEVAETEVMLMTQNTDSIQNHLIKKSKLLMYAADKHANLNKAQVNMEAFTPHIFELHGSARFMHCSNIDTKDDHHEQLIPVPSLDELNLYVIMQKNELKTQARTPEVEYVPRCQNIDANGVICGEIMKPHIQFFDDYYHESFYRANAV